MAEVEPLAIGPTWQRDESGAFVYPRLSLGWHIQHWAGQHLQYRARPWQFTGEQQRWLVHWFAVDEDLRFVHLDGVLQRLKGWGKDPMAAVLSAVEFVGPCRPSGEWTTIQGLPAGVPSRQPLGRPHPFAWVQIAAVSKDQTRNTMTLFPQLFTRETLDENEIDLGKEIIYAHHGAQRIEAVTSSPRALEGGRPTFTVANETQHWLSTNDGHEMWNTIERNTIKSADGSSRVLAITNAYDPAEDSVAQHTREAWEKMQAGSAVDTGILYDSLEAPADAQLTAEAAPDVVRAIRGDSVWLDAERIVKSILDIRNPPSRSRRFWYNQITAAEDAWATVQEWDSNAVSDRLAPGDRIVLFFDGSKTDDATGLVACRLTDGLVQPLGMWQRPHGVAEWSVPRADVDALVDNTFSLYSVAAFYADPGAGEDDSGERYWDAIIDGWATRYGDDIDEKCWAVPGGRSKHAVMWDMRAPAHTERFTAACERALAEIGDRALPHTGDGKLRDHVRNARRRPNKYGISIGKEHRESSRKIDLAVCMIGARMVRRDVIAAAPKARSGRVW